VRDDTPQRGTGYRRRDALRLAGLAGLAAAGLAAAGCGASPPSSPKPAPPAGSAAWWATQRKHGHVNFANWPLYIDPSHQTLKEFTAATGITVSYAEVIQEDQSWYNEIAPILRRGQAIGYDVMDYWRSIQNPRLSRK
jgi:spermidine/putrescine transport system substrate-binding protein